MAPRRLQPQFRTGAGMAPRRSPRIHLQIHASEEGARTARRRSTRVRASEQVAAAAEPAFLPDDDDMLREILLRLPPQPSSLLRASAVCNRWRGLVADPRFLRQFYAHHRKPPLLGVFSLTDGAAWFKFIPFLGPPDCVSPKRFNLGLCRGPTGCRLLDCRHGLVLVKDRWPTVLIVWDPVRSQERRVDVPLELKTHIFSGAVLCTAGDQGHVHGGCHTSPFKVVLMSMFEQYNRPLVYVYSSETGKWGNGILTDDPCEIPRNSGILIGNCLYWLPVGDTILKFDMAQHSLEMISGPLVPEDYLSGNGQIIRAEDGAVGYAKFYYPRLEMWQRKINVHGVATWVPWKTIKMDKILGLPSRRVYVRLQGYDVDDDILFFSYGGIYMFHLKSTQFRKLDKKISTVNTSSDRYFPFKSFFAPVEMPHIG